MLKLIKDSPVSYGVVSFLAGTFIGHRLTIGRDRRKEFNDAARPIREALLQQLSGLPNKSYRPDVASNDEFTAFSIFIGALSRGRYQKDVKTYQECFEWHPLPDVQGRRYKIGVMGTLLLYCFNSLVRNSSLLRTRILGNDGAHDETMHTLLFNLAGGLQRQREIIVNHEEHKGHEEVIR